MQYNNLPQEAVAAAIAERLIELLSQHAKVAWFVSGGSNISVQFATIQILKGSGVSMSNLTILLNDERFGPVGHADSNWQQLQDMGFMIAGPNYIEPYTGHESTLDQAVKRYEQRVTDVLAQHYAYSQLGMGDDGHTSGILPGSSASEVTDTYVCGYESDPYQRLTTTFVAMRHFDEAALVAHGNTKWPQLELLQTKTDVRTQPVQIIADIPHTTIYTDYKIEQNI